MKPTRTMTLTVIHLDQDDVPYAYVAYEESGQEPRRVSLELKLDEVQDATDLEMWAQMVAARVCDAL